MSDTALANASFPDTSGEPPPKPSTLFTERGRKALRAVGLIVVLLSVVVASGSFLIMTGTTTIEPTPEVWTLIWIANGLLVLLVVALVVTEAMLLMQSRFLGQAGSGLQLRMVAMFAAAAAVPAIIVAVVATISLNQGLDQWFSERTKTMVEASRLVARSYMLEHAQVLRDDVIWTAGELEQARSTFETDRVQYQRILTALAVTRSLPFATLVSADGDTLMKAQINAQNVSPQLAGRADPACHRRGADADLAGGHAAGRRHRQAARLR